MLRSFSSLLGLVARGGAASSRESLETKIVGVTLSIAFAACFLGVFAVGTFVGFGATERTCSIINGFLAISLDFFDSFSPASVGFLVFGLRRLRKGASSRFSKCLVGDISDFPGVNELCNFFEFRFT